jgi:hypothetical protein
MSGLDSSPGATGEESLSPLEQEVLDEYVRLAGNLGDVSLPFLSSKPCCPLFSICSPQWINLQQTPLLLYIHKSPRTTTDKKR